MIVNAVVAVLMGLFMGTTVLLLHGTQINWVSLGEVWAKITLVVTFVLALMPLNEWGEKSAKMAGCRQGTIVFGLVANILPTIIINTILGAVLPAMDIFYNEAIPKEARMGEWVAAFLGDWIPTFIAAYFFSMLAAKIGGMLADRTLSSSCNK